MHTTQIKQDFLQHMVHGMYYFGYLLQRIQIAYVNIYIACW